MSEDNSTDSIQFTPDNQSLRSYWFFFSGQLVSLFGSSVVQFAIIWWLTVTSQSNPKYAGQAGTILGIASFAGFFPFLMTSLFAGVLVDRWNRKIVIAIADFIQAFVTGILIILFYVDQASLPYVLIVLAIRAMAQGFHSPATQAIIPLLVPREKLTRVNSFENIFNSTINLLGPVFGALLIELFGVENLGHILWIDLITFLFAIIPTIKIFIPDITKEKRKAKETSFKQEFGEGIGFIRKTKGLLSLLITFTVVNIVSAPVFVLIPLVIKDPELFNGGASIFAIFVALSQGGAILGGVIMARKPIFKKNAKGVAFGQSMIYVSIFMIIIGVYQVNLIILFIGAFFDGLSLPFANIPSQTIWQSVVPPDLQGRVMSVRSVIAWTMIPVSELVGGYISDQVGILNVFIGGFLIGLVFLVYAWFMTDFPRVEQILGINQDTPIAETPEPGSTVPS